MTAVRRFQRRTNGAVVLLVIVAGTHVAGAQPAREETASSEFRSGYGAVQAADGIAEENGNYWQTLEGAFGKAEVNVTFPAVVRLYLRGPDGRLNDQSLLADTRHPRWTPHGRFRVQRPWAEGGCTYVVGQDQTRYESRLDSPENVEQSDEDGGTLLRLTGVKLAAGKDEKPVATEDWTLSARGNELVWKIVRAQLNDG